MRSLRSLIRRAAVYTMAEQREIVAPGGQFNWQDIKVPIEVKQQPRAMAISMIVDSFLDMLQAIAAGIERMAITRIEPTT